MSDNFITGIMIAGTIGMMGLGICARIDKLTEEIKSARQSPLVQLQIPVQELQLQESSIDDPAFAFEGKGFRCTYRPNDPQQKQLYCVKINNGEYNQ